MAGDLVDEDDENYTIGLSNPSNATLGDDLGLGTITDNDALPALSVGDVTVTEGNAGTVNAVFTVTLSPLSGRAVAVNYATANDSATAGPDYVVDERHAQLRRRRHVGDRCRHRQRRPARRDQRARSSST